MRARIGTSADVGNLVRSAGTYVSTVAVQAFGGFLFWIVAAHRATTEAVGLAAALATSITFILYASNLGLTVSLGRFAVRDTFEDRQRFLLAILATSVTSVIASATYLVIFDQPATQTVHDARFGPVILALLAAFTAVANLVDIRLLALRHRGLVIARGATCGLARVLLILLVPPGVADDPIAVLLMLNGPDAVTGIAVAAYLSRGTWRPLLAGRWRPPQLGEAVRYAWVSNFSQLALLAPIMGLPVVVLLIVPPVENASFYIAWSVAAVVTLIPMATLWSLHLEGGRDGSHLRRQVRFALLTSVSLTTVLTVLSVPGSLLVTVIYGEEFETAQRILPWLILGTIPWSISVVFLSEARVTNHARLALATSFTNAGVCLGLGVVLTQLHGVGGAVVAWVLGNSMAALVAWTGRSLVGRRSGSFGDELVGGVAPGPPVAVHDPAPDRRP